jgi:hypothetical protein
MKGNDPKPPMLKPAEANIAFIFSRMPGNTLKVTEDGRAVVMWITMFYT